MGMGRFMHRLPNDVIIAWFDVDDYSCIFDLIFNIKLDSVAHRNWVGDLQVFDFEFPFQTGLVNVTILIPNVVPRTCGAYD